MNAPPPPRIAAAVLARVAPRHWYESLAGDLSEEFARRVAGSPQRAAWWYRWQVLRVLIVQAIRFRPRVRSAGGVMDRVLTDVVSAWRVLRRRPRFAMVLVAVLGGSLGTSATVLTIADAYLWRPLPYPAAERLVTFPRTGAPSQARPPRDRSALSRDGLLAEVADLAPAVDLDGFTIVDGSTPTTVLGLWTTADLFEALDTRPVLGRTFTAAEVASAAPVALISHSVWMDRYGGDPSIVGRRITLRGVERTDVTTPFTVIGVLPPRFWHLDSRVAILAPLKKDTGDVVFFRLKTGIGIVQASSRLNELIAAMNADLDPAWKVRLSPLQEDHVEPIRPLLSAVILAVAMLLLIACANVGMLQTMRALGREQEMAIRSALGAGRTRVFTQLLVENGLLAIASFVLALLIVHGLVGALLPAVESYVGRLAPGGPAAVVPGVRVLAIMGMIAIAGTIVFGAIAGVRVRQDVETLRTHGAGTETQRRARLRHGLAVLQVGAAFALLVGAALAMRTAWHVSRVDLGLDPAEVVTSSLVLAPPGYPDDPSRRSATVSLLDALQRSPEIETAGLITVPAFGIRFPRPVFREGEPDQGAPTAVLIGVNGGYFDTVRLRLIAGRALSEAESQSADPVAVVSASLAARLFGSREAIGRTVTTTGLRPMLAGVEVGPPVRTTYRIVGVVADVRRSLRRDAVAEMYVPLAQASLRDLTLQVRGRDGVPFADVSAAIARAVSSVDRDVPLNDVEPLESLIARQGLRPRFIATLLGLFAALAALGALAGLYAVSAWVAGQRRREAAIRVALGANRAQVIRALTAASLVSVTAGLLAGWWASLLLGRLMTRELTGVSGEDPTTRAVAAIVLFVCCAAAVYRPARALTLISPAETLRE